ncbi:MAG: helix-turn-helix transcriptional regulator [Candidatus Jacksonbacteria bacterium]
MKKNKGKTHQKSIYSQEQLYLVAQLKKARREAGLNQGIVADSLGRTQSYLSKLESGQRRIDVIQLKKLARIYKKELEFFVK